MKDLKIFLEQQDVDGSEIFDKVKGKNPEASSVKAVTKGAWAIQPPVPPGEKWEAKKMEKSEQTKIVKWLMKRFRNWETNGDFFIQGEAGWGKTSIIEQVAKRFGFNVITVYLDKIMKEDLGGIPIPRENKKTGSAYTQLAMPGWAEVINDMPDEKFLLFFDEMNQADPAVMNALMPIILKKTVCNVQMNNFFVGAAGNFEFENEGGVTELPAPLAARFHILRLQVDESSWKSAFDHLHSKWDDKLGKDFVDETDKRHIVFKSPRDIERKFFEDVWGIKNGTDKMFDAEDLDVDDYLEDILACARESKDDNENRKIEQMAKELAQMAFNWVNKSEKQSSKRERTKGNDMIDDKIKHIVLQGMTQGFWHVDNADGRGNNADFGISRENIFSIVDDGTLNREQINRLLDQYEDDGYKFKYETDQEWKDAGYDDASDTDKWPD